jgi:chitin synthase
MKWKKWLKPAGKDDAPHGTNGTDMELHEMENGQLRGGEKKKKKDGSDMCSRFVVTAVQLLFLVMQLAGMALLMIKSKLWWEIPVSLILCSISWWKNFVFIDRLDTHWADGFKRNRYASSFVKTFAKIAFILIFVTIIARYKFHMDTAAMLAPSLLAKTFVNSHGLWYALIGSWVAFYTCWLSCLACMQIFCVALPVLLTTPLAIFYQTWNCKYYIYGAAWSSCKTFTTGDLSDGYIIAGGVLLWLSFIIVSGHLWGGIDKRDANQLEEDMWTQPEAFSCVFIEQSIALNRNRNPKVVKSLDGEVEYGFHAHRTFITTTMYHESKIEMQKLVMSLLQIDAEIPTEDKVADYYEAHIIFDDAFLKQPNPKPDHFEYSPFYNQWVFYLLDIFSELKLKRLGDPVVVWYGEVVTFKFALGMKLVVHLKDVTKIKQKKRWSQILYMHVILEDVLDNENKLGMLDANTFILMIDGDTQFSRKSVNLMRHMIELDRERSGAICGRIFPEGSSNPVVWYQKFEYAVGHWMQKTAEHVFGSVLCSPGCFSLVRIAALYRKSGEQMDGQSAAIEVYSKEVESAMDVLKFDQGEDRMLSTLIIKSGWRLQYCAGAEAGTFCPEAFGDFFKQRRRWISSTLANLYFLIASGSDIVKTNASVSPPFMLYTAGVFASSIFGPATIILVTIGGMAYAFSWYGATAYGWGLGLPLFYCAVCIVFNLNMETDTARKKSKKIDMQVGAAFLLCALYALLMGAVMIGVIASSISDPTGPDAIFLIVLSGTFIIAATLHGEFWLLLYGIVYLFLLPTMYLILILFAVANIHDQSWGTRDGSGGSKETDADKFFSISKLGFYFRDMKASFKEAFYDELPPKKKEEPEDPWKRADYWKVSDDGKEEIVMLEEERRKLEEEKKKQEEEKKKQEEERQLREIERQKEEAKKKKQESEERERLQERLKQERRRGIHHKYKDHLSSLSRRLKNKVQTEDKPNEKDVAAEKLERIRQLAALQQMSCFMLFLVTSIWLILVVTFGIHPELNLIKTNAAGLMFLISFGIIQAFQFTASIFHRLETMLNALANIPMTVECNFVEEGKKYDRMVTLKQQEQELNAGREKIASKVARKLLMVDKRTSTKANLLS